MLDIWRSGPENKALLFSEKTNPVSYQLYCSLSGQLELVRFVRKVLSFVKQFHAKCQFNLMKVIGNVVEMQFI